MSCLSSDLPDFLSCVSSGLAVNCLKATIEKKLEKKALIRPPS